MNRSQMRIRILESLNDSITSPVFYSTTEIDDLIDEAGEVLAEEAQAIKRSTHVPLRAGTQYYYTTGLAPDIIAPYRIWIEGINRRLQAVSFSELDQRNERWTDPNDYPWAWCPISWNLFCIYPHPANAGGIMRVDYIAWPRTLLDDGDESEFPESDQRTMILYGVYEGLLKMFDLQQALTVFSQFVGKVIDAQARAGIRTMDAREFRPPAQPYGGFRSGIQQ